LSPELATQLYTILGIVGPALVAFVIGHTHVLLKNPAVPSPATPSPATPAAPVDPNNLPVGQGGILQTLARLGNALPKVDPTKPVAPIGQGGILQMATLFLQGILSSSATPAAKAAAVNQVVAAVQSLEPEAPK